MQLCLYKLVMPEREVAVCFADEGRNSCPELRIFFLLASHGLLLHDPRTKHHNNDLPSKHTQNCIQTHIQLASAHMSQFSRRDRLMGSGVNVTWATNSTRTFYCFCVTSQVCTLCNACCILYLQNNVQNIFPKQRSFQSSSVCLQYLSFSLV